MLKSSLCDSSYAYILAKRNITIAPASAPAANPDNNKKEVVFIKCASFTDCIIETNNTQIDNAKDINAVMPMYNLI